MASRIESVCKSADVFISGGLCDFLPEEKAEKAGVYEFKGGIGEQNVYRLVES